MADEVQKEFVRSFINFLKRPSTSQHMSADCKESVDVSIQCLQAAFDISDEAIEEAASCPEANKDKNLDLFEIFESLFIERSPEVSRLAESFKNEGNRLMKDGKYNEALLQYNRAIAFDPKNPIYYCNRAAAHIRLNNNDNAITDCKTALLYKPTYSKAYGRLGIAYSNLNKFSEAQQAYEKAIELEPDNQDYRNNLEVARDAAQSRMSLPNMSDGLSSAAIRNILNNSGIDLEELQALSQDAAVVNAVNHFFSDNNGGANGFPVFPGDVLRRMQSFITRMASAQVGENFNDASNSNPDSGAPNS